MMTRRDARTDIPAREPKRLTAIDLFCGSGAVTEGLSAEGIQVLAAVDSDPVCCGTYRANHAEVCLFECDIRELDAVTVRAKLSFPGPIDLLVVCAPCQPFSTQNRNRGAYDSRADLVLQSLKFIAEFVPTLVFFENVPGIASIGPIEHLRQSLASLGYVLGQPKVLDAAKYGVAQRRARCIMVAAKDGSRLAQFSSALDKKPPRTVADVIGHLPALKSGERDPSDPLHFARKHQKITLERLQYIPKDGGSRSSLPPHLQLLCHKGRDGDFPDVYGRMKWAAVAPTLTTGCTDLTKGRYVHPRDDRAITLREAALLQSFPPDYKFCGNGSQIARQIGNAVPVGLVRSLASAFRNSLA